VPKGSVGFDFVFKPGSETIVVALGMSRMLRDHRTRCDLAHAGMWLWPLWPPATRHGAHG
jgi:hypothetical protein